MKLLIALFFLISVIPVSIVAGMMWGWGLEPENWGWIAFSYMYVMLAPMIADSIKD